MEQSRNLTSFQDQKNFSFKEVVLFVVLAIIVTSVAWFFLLRDKNTLEIKNTNLNKNIISSSVEYSQTTNGGVFDLLKEMYFSGYSVPYAIKQFDPPPINLKYIFYNDDNQNQTLTLFSYQTSDFGGAYVVFDTVNKKMYKDLFSLACDEDCSEWDLGYPVAVLGLQKLLVVNQNKIIVTDFSGKVIKELLSFNESENIYIPMPYGSNQQGVQFQIVSKVNSDYEPQKSTGYFLNPSTLILEKK